MPPKKKASEAAGPSASIPLPPEPTARGGDVGGRTDAGEDTHGAAKSKDKTDDRAHSKTSASVHAPRPSQEAPDRQRRGTQGTIRLLGQGQSGGSRDAQGQRSGTSKVRSPGRDA